MMPIGIFAKTFVRDSVEATLDAVAAHGIQHVQFNMACANVQSMPDRIDAALAQRIREAHAVRGISMAAISGTFNMAHPSAEHRKDGLKRLNVLAAACRAMGTRLITLCTGSRDPENMWRRHPDNDTEETWRTMRASVEQAVEIAEAHNVTLGIEPEVSNIVDSAARAWRLLDEIRSPRLKIIMDGANLFHAGELPRMAEILNRAFDLLGEDIALAHAKDLSRDGEAGHDAAGTGVLDYDRYIALLRRHGYSGPLVLHGLTEDQVPASAAFLKRKLAVAGGGSV